MSKNITDAFEIPTDEEWDRYLSTNIFDKMMIDSSIIKCSDDMNSKMVFTKILSVIQAHNNKVESIKISYALARHYFDKGIPDDEWYCFFMEDLYSKVQSMGDTLYLFINEFYEFGIEEGLGFVKKVLNKLKTTNPSLYDFLNNSHKDENYIKASNFRNNIIHGISPNEIKDEIVIQRNVETDIMKKDANGNFIKQNVKASLQITSRVGDYVTSKELLKSLEKFADYMGDISLNSISIIAKDEFVVKI